MHLVILRRNQVRLPERLPKSLRPYGQLSVGAGALDESDEDDERAEEGGGDEGELNATAVGVGGGGGGGGGGEDAHEHERDQLHLEEQAPEPEPEPEDAQTSTTEDESGQPRPKPVSFDFTPPLSKVCAVFTNLTSMFTLPLLPFSRRYLCPWLLFLQSFFLIFASLKLFRDAFEQFSHEYAIHKQKFPYLYEVIIAD